MRFLLVLVGMSLLLMSCNTSHPPQTNDDSSHNKSNISSILPTDLLFTADTRGMPYYSLNTLMRVDAQTLQTSSFYVADSDFIRPLSWSPSGELLAFLRWSSEDYLEICLLTREGVLQSCFKDSIVKYLFLERGSHYMVTWSEDERYVYFVTDYGQYHRVYDVIESWGASLVEADVATGQTRRMLHQIEVANQLPSRIYWTEDLHYVESFPPGEATKTIDLWQNTEYLLPQEIPDMGHLTFCDQFSPQGQYLTAQASLDNVLTGWVLTTPEGQIVQTVSSDRLQQAEISWMECPIWQSDDMAFYFLGGTEEKNYLFKYVLADDKIIPIKQLSPSETQAPFFVRIYPETRIWLAPDNMTLAISFKVAGSTGSKIHILTPTHEWLTDNEGTLVSFGGDLIWFPIADSD